MAETLDIKDFATQTTFSDSDFILGVKNGADAKIAFSVFKQLISQGTVPTIGSNGNWYIGGIDTGVSATLNFDDLTDEQKAQLIPTYDDFTPEQKEALKGDPGDPFTIYNTYTTIEAMEADFANVPRGQFVVIDGSVEDPDTGKLYNRGETSFAYITDLSGMQGFTGKTPIITVGTVTQTAVGSQPTITQVSDGVDPQGNPKFKINYGLPAPEKGDAGLPPIIGEGTTQTGEPNTLASIQFIRQGSDPSGAPIYIPLATLPKGEPGKDGLGSGNVYVEIEELLASKTYLFKPSANGSASGTFVEYEIPEIENVVKGEGITDLWGGTKAQYDAITTKNPTTLYVITDDQGGEIPTNLSQLVNDVGFITISVDNLVNYYKKTETYTRSEVDNAISAVVENLDWKESVATFSDLATTYPDAEDGWTVNTNDTDYTYRYNGTAWVVISANAIPLATPSVDGKMSKEDKAKLDGIQEGANNYELPYASSVIKGGIRIESVTIEGKKQLKIYTND